MLTFQPVKPVSCFVNSSFSFTVRAKNFGKPMFTLECGKKDGGSFTSKYYLAVYLGENNMSEK